MDNRLADEVATTPKWRTIIRQHSAKIGTFAEDVVLPKNERDSRQAAKNEDLAMQNIEAQYTRTHPSTARKRSVPTVSNIYIVVYYSVDRTVMLLLFGYDPHRRHEVWRLITMMLVHSTPSHLWHNVAMQVVFGGLLEIVHHWKRIGLIYLTSVFGGALFISVLSNHYTSGASGGVYGLAFSHLATITLNWKEMDKKFCGLFLFSLSVYFVYDAGFSLFNGIISKNKNSHISHVCHLGGAVTGLLVSILVLKNFKIEQWETKMQKVCVSLLTCICGVIVNVAASGYYVPTEWNF